MPSLPELVIIDLFNSLVDRIKQARPAQTNGKPTGGDIVYSQLLLGMPIDPVDYNNAWSPIGLASVAGQTAGVPAVAGQPDPALLRALEAAFHTSQLCNIMLQVTTDGSYLEYPIGRSVVFAYKSIVDGMIPLPVPPLPASEQAALDAATAVLYNLDKTDPQNPVITGKTPLYATYTQNALAYARAKSNYAVGQAMTLANPAQAGLWPMISATYQEAVDDAWNTWKTEGADKIEAALAAYESQGINIQQAQIAAAKKQLDVWSLGLAGVPVDIPYSYVDPSAWSDPTNDQIGFEQLQIKRTSEDHVASSVSKTNGSMWWNNGTSTLTQSGHAGFAGIASGSENTSNADQHTAKTDASGYNFSSWKADHFTDFEVDLEWGLVTIYRPWLVSDLFYMNNWYIQGQRAHWISDGTIANQAADQPQSVMSELPLLTQQMLVVRNVSVKSSSWGDTASVLNSLYSGDASQTDATQSTQSGTVGAKLGPISFGGSAQHGKTTDTGAKSNYNNASNLSRNGASFDGTTLSINGAQIIAFVSNIVPPSPTIDDPALPKPKSDSNSIAGVSNATSTTAPATAGAAS